MSTYNKNLYTSTNSAIDAGVVYDQTEDKMQNELNAEFKNDISSIITAATAPSLVTNWLNANITQETGYVIDESLTIESTAPDAKITGQLINGQCRELPMTWIAGGYISADTGNVLLYDTWKYSDYVDVSGLTHGCVFIRRKAPSSDSGVIYNAMYDADKRYIGRLVLPSSYGYVHLYAGTCYIRVSCGNTTSIRMYDALFKDQSVTKPIRWYRRVNNTSNTFISEKIYLEEAKYQLTVPSGYLVSIEYYNSNDGVISFTQYLGSREFWRQNNNTYILLYLKKSDESVISINDLNIDTVTVVPKKNYKISDYFRIVSFNVGQWHDGVTKQPDETASEYAAMFRRFLGAINPEIIGMLEAPSTINVGNTYPAVSLYEHKLPFQYRAIEGAGGLSVAAKNSIMNPQLITFASGSGRYACSFKYEIGSATVKIYIVHLSVEANTTGIRQQDLQEIAGWLSNNEHCIVMGDFNTYDMSELEIFSGYNICNGGNFGDFITWPGVSASWPNGAIDNVVTTRNISIQNVYVPNVSLSDHRPIVVDFSVYY